MEVEWQKKSKNVLKYSVFKENERTKMPQNGPFGHIGFL